jgi:uncharacterized protein YgbK (DUF1537 family)
VAQALRREGLTEKVFKKVDSVLRGHVVLELSTLLETWSRRRAMLVPANPGLGRMVTEGQYQVDGHPLHETDFSRDPEYPATTSDVLEILGLARSRSACVLSPDEDLPSRGILVGEAICEADLTAWAKRLDEETLPAGAAEFFAAFLRTTGAQLTNRDAVEVEPNEWETALFVCGSPSSSARAFCRKCEARGVPVLRMPARLFELSEAGGVSTLSSRLVREWAEEAVRALRAHPQAVVAIDRPLRRKPGLPQTLSRRLAELIEQVLDMGAVDHIFVTGGATAVALVRKLGWRRLGVRQELAPGVVCMQVEGRARPLLTMKPGSYAWPEQILRPAGRQPRSFSNQASALRNPATLVEDSDHEDI